jgi:hypothetical protein
LGCTNIPYRLGGKLLLNRKGESMNGNEISVEINGKIYRGSCSIRGRVITVSSAYGQKSTQIGNSHPDVLAKMLLRELVRDSKTDA